MAAVTATAASAAGPTPMQSLLAALQDMGAVLSGGLSSATVRGAPAHPYGALALETTISRYFDF